MLEAKYTVNTDTLYIKFKESISTESELFSTGIVLDYYENNTLVGIDLDNVSTLKLNALQLVRLLDIVLKH